jgi:hypothetical protein
MLSVSRVAFAHPAPANPTPSPSKQAAARLTGRTAPGGARQQWLAR